MASARLGPSQTSRPHGPPWQGQSLFSAWRIHLKSSVILRRGLAARREFRSRQTSSEGMHVVNPLVHNDDGNGLDLVAGDRNLAPARPRGYVLALR